ncbi:S1C family serine protease [Paenibacillus thailandensis]|uniref:S1C family serine protease n=1 Tax=Paenibacillus thailandensis TaxID=393250 RepID=A0ABW5R0Q2_9BACL
MSLFNDDFYSTKVPRRAKAPLSRREMPFPRRSGGRSWSNVRIAFVSSFTSAIAATLLFAAVFGYGGSGRGFGDGSATTAAGAVQLADPSERTVQASAKVRPAVVSIINEQTGWFAGAEEGDAGAGEMQEAGVGSGVIFKKDGGKAFIITNYHVIENAENIQAVLSGGEKRKAEVVGKDQISDLAVLSISGEGIDTVAEIGDSSKLRAAEYVIAIGNPLGLGESVSMGIVSKTRQIVPVSLNQNGVYDWEQEVIQVDASINQGNSGGPLIDLDGRVVGINSMKIADFGVEGIGFAIPVNNAMPVVETLMEKGYVPRPYLGVITDDLELYWEDQAMEQDEAAESGGESDGADEGDSLDLHLPDEVYSGVIVLEAVGPAKEAGLRLNDVITKLDGHSIGSTMELRKYLYGSKEIGDKIEVTYYRGDKEKTVSIVLGENTGGE